MKVPIGYALAWSELELAPEVPGVYAWYARVAISKADIESIVRRVEEARLKSESEARKEVEEALDRFIFGPYRETPYQVALRGQLKPKYSGEVVHEPSRSESLVSRLATNPKRFRTVAEILRNAAPWFTAPLYIGMASNLRTRLKQHRNRIVELRDLQGHLPNDENAEAGFANQVAARNFDPTNLFVHIAEVNLESGEHNDLENILNRINYPIFGRN